MTAGEAARCATNCRAVVGSWRDPTGEGEVSQPPQQQGRRSWAPPAPAFLHESSAFEPLCPWATCRRSDAGMSAFPTNRKTILAVPLLAVVLMGGTCGQPFGSADSAVTYDGLMILQASGAAAVREGIPVEVKPEASCKNTGAHHGRRVGTSALRGPLLFDTQPLRRGGNRPALRSHLKNHAYRRARRHIHAG